MAKVIVSNPFVSVKELALSHHIVLPKPHEWRLLSSPSSGEVQGLSGIRGVGVATNGIHVAILSNEKIQIAHLDWFVADEQDTAQRTGATAKASRMPTENIFANFSLD